jgi:catechol 2,3-dioxygenase-like lactoylglutathione lyase family enzyme
MKLAVATLITALALQAAPQETAHFHHVHLNVVDAKKSVDFYAKTFGAVPVKYNGAADGVFVERSFILFNTVAAAADASLNSSMDVVSEAAWLQKKGVEFQTPPTPLGQNFYTYLYGADRELIEIYSGEQNHRFNHVHLLAADVNVTSQWYADQLGVTIGRREAPKPANRDQFWVNSIRADNVTFYVFGKPEGDPPPAWWAKQGASMKTLEPTKGRVIDHIAFSYRAIAAVLERMKKAGVTIVEPIAVREPYKIKSFFVQGPDNVLVEIVEAKPIPEGIWEPSQ